MDHGSIPACASCGKLETELPGDSKLLRCGRCKATRYCNKQCQSSAWKEHRKICSPSFDTANQAQSATRLKRVLLITLEDFSWLEDMYANFYSMIRASYESIEVTKANAAIDAIATNPAAVILFEPSVTRKAKNSKYQPLNNALVSYTKAGGTVIFGCQCSCHIRPADLEWYFPTVWDLPWQTGNYARYDFKQTPAVSTINGMVLPKDYNVKALQLRNVDKDAVIYWEQGEAHGLLTQMAKAGITDFEPHGPNPEGNGGPVIWKKYENGWVAWLGDVNNEDETRQTRPTSLSSLSGHDIAL